MRLMTGVMMLILAAQQASTPPLNSLMAKEHVGEVATICGHVVSYRCSQTDGTSLRFATNNSSFVEFRIPKNELAKFGTNPEDQYLDRIVCSTGVIEKRNTERLERIEIAVTDPKTVEIRRDRPGLPPFAPGVHRPCDPGVTLPKVKKQVKPQYTDRASRERIAGAVLVQMVVNADGKPGEVRVIRSLDKDLDAQAIKAVREWRFEAGTLERRPVPIVVTIDMVFTLR
jgi:TonB family protein